MRLMPPRRGRPYTDVMKPYRSVPLSRRPRGGTSLHCKNNTIVGAAPDDKATLTAQWQGNKLSLLGRLNQYGKTTRVFNFGDGFEPEQTYGSKVQLDAEIGYRLFDQIQVYLGASNLLDEYPDRSSDDINYFGNFPYDVLSPIGFNGRFVYGGLRASF